MEAPKALQDEAEIDAFAELLAREGVRSYLEVGSKFGGSVWRIAPWLGLGARIVSVDLPEGARQTESQATLKRVVGKLGDRGFDAHLILGDSTARDTVEAVAALGPFDAVLIDANHTLPYVTADFRNYAPMARLVAFHDIAWRRAPEWVGTRIEVPEFWDQVKGGYPHEEIRMCPTGKNNGIGVLWTR